MTPAVRERFDSICATITARGNGMTLTDLADAHVLARELESGAPDRDRVEAVAARLELDEGSSS